ncbi:MAG: hypothetical protein WDA60_10900 [Acidimicrobiia bacterium]|jgi:hypothetical protein
MRTLVALALVATVAIAGGASASPAGAAVGPAARPASCKLLKNAEITAALDQPAGPGTDEIVPEVCQWPLLATADRAPGTVNSFVERGARAREDFAIAVDFAAGEGERVPDLGRKAVYNPSVGALYVLADRSTLFYVQANLYAADKTRITDGLRESLVELANRVEPRV